MSNSDRAWSVRPASAQAHKQWRAAVQAEPELMEAVRERLRTRPMDRSDNPRRLGQLKGKLATRRIVWVTKVALRHPKETG